MSIRSAAGVVVALALLGGCGTNGGEPLEEPVTSSAVSPVAASAGEWEPMSAAPLEPRGGALPVWTGERLLLLGGFRSDEQQPPCPPSASCIGVEPTLFDDGAAWDPAADAWTRVVDPTGAVHGLSQRGDGTAWSGTSVFTRFQRTTPDLAAGTLTSQAFDAGPVLVFADPMWTGDRLVTVGWGGTWDPGALQGQLVAQTYDPVTDTAATTVLQTGPPQGENMWTVWTGREVLAFFSTRGTGVGVSGGPVAAFDPATSTWRTVTDHGASPWDAVWDGRRVVVEEGDRLLTLDLRSGVTSELAGLPDDRLGELQVSASGRLLLQGSPSYLLVEDDDGDSRWLRVPDPPRSEPTTASTVAWAGDDLVVWGGTQAYEDDGGATRSTADGWVWRGLGAVALTP